jgi:multisubunit Na+/H+ antiporter MnhB subunit
MKTLLANISPRHQMLLRQLGWALLVILVLASLPFLFNILNHAIDWITEVFVHPPRSWEVPL